MSKFKFKPHNNKLARALIPKKVSKGDLLYILSSVRGCALDSGGYVVAMGN